MAKSQNFLNKSNFRLNYEFISVNGGDSVVTATTGILHTDGETGAHETEQGAHPEARHGQRQGGIKGSQTQPRQSEPVGALTNNQTTDIHKGPG